MDTSFSTRMGTTGKQITSACPPGVPKPARMGISPPMQGTSRQPSPCSWPCALAVLCVLRNSIQSTNQQKTNLRERKGMYYCHFSELNQPVPGYGKKAETAFLQQQRCSIWSCETACCAGSVFQKTGWLKHSRIQLSARRHFPTQKKAGEVQKIEKRKKVSI